MDEVADGVFVATSRRDATTSTLVVDGSEVLLVDPAWGPDELEALADLIDERGWHVVAGISTHAHHDHLLWHPRFGNVPRYTTATTVALAHEHEPELRAALGPDWPPELANLLGGLRAAPAAPPLGARLIEHDGHAPGHCAVWLADRHVLVAGDMLSDVELPLPLWPDDLASYLAGLDRLAPYVEQAWVLIPGHGHVTRDPRSRLAADRRYFADLNEQGDSDDPRRRNEGMDEVHRAVRALVHNDQASGPATSTSSSARTT